MMTHSFALTRADSRHAARPRNPQAQTIQVIACLFFVASAVLGTSLGHCQNIIYQKPITNSYPIDSYPIVTYPSSSYPVTSYPTTVYPVTSYPANSYPIDYQSVPASTTIRSTANSSIPLASPTSSAPRFTTRTDSRESRSLDSGSDPKSQGSTSQGSGDHTGISRLASTRSGDSRSTSSSLRRSTGVGDSNRDSSPFEYRDSYRDQYHEAFPTPVQRLLPFGSTMIQSARQSAIEFRRIAQRASPVAASVAERNAELAEQWAELAETHDGLTDRLNLAADKLQSTSDDFEDVSAKIDHYGLTPTVGLLLRHKKDQLDAWQVQDSQTYFAGEELKRARGEQLELDLIQYDGSDTISQAAMILTAGGLNPKNDANSDLISQVRTLLHQRSQWLESLRNGYQNYQQKLGELDAATTASTQLTHDYRRLIDRQITWIRSDDPLSFRDVGEIPSGIGALLDSRRSHAFGQSIQRKWQANPVAGIAMLGSILILALLRLRLRSWLVDIGAGNRMRDSSSNSRRVASGVLTTMMALVIPAMLYWIARWLGGGVVSESTLHASAGFYAASLVALVVEIPRQSFRNFGYLDRHVTVELPGRERAMTYLTLIGTGLVMAGYLITLVAAMDHGMWRGSTARFGFIAAMFLVAWTAH